MNTVVPVKDAKEVVASPTIAPKPGQSLELINGFDTAITEILADQDPEIGKILRQLLQNLSQGKLHSAAALWLRVGRTITEHVASLGLIDPTLEKAFLAFDGHASRPNESMEHLKKFTTMEAFLGVCFFLNRANGSVLAADYLKTAQKLCEQYDLLNTQRRDGSDTKKTSV